MFEATILKNEMINTMNRFFLKYGITKVKYNNVLVKLPLFIHSNDYDSLSYAINNQMNTFLVIQEMGIGLFVSNHSLKKLPYCEALFRNDSSYKTPSMYYVNRSTLESLETNTDSCGCRLILIHEEWDTSEWNPNKLLTLSSWLTYIDDHFLESQENRENIGKVYVAECSNYLKHCIDYSFLETMGLVINNEEE